MPNDFATPAKSVCDKYLLCYFTGNEPHEERICFAVSKDGYHFVPLNGGKPVIEQKTGTLCMRDPYILRDRNDGFYIVATDMKSSDGWASNHGVVSWHSDDLICWDNECATDFHQFEATETADKIWAPEALFDDRKEAYMVYYSVHNTDSPMPLAIWYSYTKDFKNFTEPKLLFAPDNGLDAIDADIIAFDGKYYMFYKDEYHKTICGAVADEPDGEYRSFSSPVVACTERDVEGCCIYPINGTDSFVMIMDMYSDGRYFMQQTADMLHFAPVDAADFDLGFHPRHASVLTITDSEYQLLIKEFGLR